MSTEEKKLVRFARAVLRILQVEEDWGSEQLGEIANAAADCGLDVSPPPQDE